MHILILLTLLYHALVLCLNQSLVHAGFHSHRYLLPCAWNRFEKIKWVTLLSGSEARRGEARRGAAAAQHKLPPQRPRATPVNWKHCISFVWRAVLELHKLWYIFRTDLQLRGMWRKIKIKYAEVRCVVGVWADVLTTPQPGYTTPCHLNLVQAISPLQ